MKIKICITAVVLITTFLIGCGNLGTKNEITVKFDGQEKTFEPKAAFAWKNDLAMNSEKSWSLQIVLANYEIDDSKGSFGVDRSIKNKDQVRVSLLLYGEKGKDKNSEIRTGEYVTKPASDPFDRVANSFVIYFKDDKEEKVMMNTGSKYAGKVNITSVENNVISGTVDISSDRENTSIKGTFSAPIK